MNLNKLTNWTAPGDWRKITTIDAHTEGEPLRIFTSGLPELIGNTILEKRRYFKENYDYLRTTMIDAEIEISELGTVKFDIAYGGAFYAYVNADDLNISMKAENFNELIHKGMLIKKEVMKNFEIKHPFEDDLSFLYGTIFYGKAHNNFSDSRNVCIFAEGEVDRSPTGTGVSGRIAMEFAN
ncbi:unnamed protein product, partial [Cyprideis torosa]